MATAPPSPRTKRSYDDAFYPEPETLTIQHVYKKIDVSKGGIRLLKLHGGTDLSLRGNLIPHSKGSSYEALSYTWGPKMPESFIEILYGGVGIKLPVTPNLEAALRQLRNENNPRKSRLLWVDAICINQDDDAEKSDQVPKMGRVFSQADTVLVWLGKEEANSSKAIGFVQNILDFDNVDQLLSSDKFLMERKAMFDLIRRPWFSRRWVIQEIALARTASVHCGKDHVPWAEFADAVSLFAKKHAEQRSLHEKSHKNNTAAMFFGDVEELGATRLVQVSSNLFRKSDEHGTPEALCSLEKLVSDLSAFEATKTHDTIYAVLALAEDTIFQSRSTDERDGQQGETIDMTESQRQAASDFIATLRNRRTERQFPSIRRSESVDIICRPWAPTNTDERLPSWIPKLSGSPFKPSGRGILTRIRADPLVGNSDLGFRHYNASLKYPIKCKFGKESNDRSLFIDGFVLDLINSREETSQQGNIPFAWLSAGGWEQTNELPPERFWRTLVADRDLDGRNPPTYYSRACKNAYAQGVQGDDLNPNKIITDGCAEMVAQFLRRVMSVVWMRRMIVTRRRNFLGLAPYDAVDGDIICILFGCSVPVVLREHRSEGGSYYTFIGECYVHTMMDGGAFRIKNADNILKTTFELR